MQRYQTGILPFVQYLILVSFFHHSKYIHNKFSKFIGLHCCTRSCSYFIKMMERQRRIWEAAVPCDSCTRLGLCTRLWFNCAILSYEFLRKHEKYRYCPNCTLGNKCAYLHPLIMCRLLFYLILSIRYHPRQSSVF